MDINLDIALRKLHELQLQDGDLGAEYWLTISQLLKDAASYRERALVAEKKLQNVQEVLGLLGSTEPFLERVPRRQSEL